MARSQLLGMLPCITMKDNYNKEDFYKAHLARDIRFDGQFFVAVKTTGIYCRPICPARKAKLENIEFFIHAAEAEEAGYRPCLRCRPETAPGSAAWLGTSATVRRAVRIMDNIDLGDISISQLAIMLGVSERWLRKLFQEQVGVSPQKLFLDKKLSIARNLLDNADMTITDIAFASGFNTIRRFNDAFLKKFNKAPSALRRKGERSNTQTLFLRYRPPFAWDKLMVFFSYRAIPGMEKVVANQYERLIMHNGTVGWMQVSLADNYRVRVDFSINATSGLLSFVAKIKDMFDLDCDPMLISNDLARDKKLKPLLEQHQGLRIPGCFNQFELVVRAIVGQRISVKAAQTVLLRLLEKFGDKHNNIEHTDLTYVFPSPKTILNADLSNMGLTSNKIHSIKEVAKALVENELLLDGTADYKETYATLLEIKGIGHWTVEYIAMRLLKNPDAFPESDLELQKKIKKYQLDSSKWLPWRSYVAILLFSL